MDESHAHEETLAYYREIRMANASPKLICSHKRNTELEDARDTVVELSNEYLLGNGMGEDDFP